MNNKLTFSGHDTFHCRHLWLKKGYDFIKSGHKFSNEDAVVLLGVGKNMVSSINFWMKAFGILDKAGKLTDFAVYLLDDDGKDPYLEDEASLWLLHYQLVTQELASTYNLIFNDFRKEKIEFTKEQYISFVARKAEELGINAISRNTVAADFEVLAKIYLRTDVQSKDKEDTFSGLLTDLGLIKEERRRINDKLETYYNVVSNEKEEIAEEVILFAILDYGNFDKSISLRTIEQERNHVCSVFCINKIGLHRKIESIAANAKHGKYGIVFNDHAGIKELQFKEKPNRFEVLDFYYDK